MMLSQNALRDTPFPVPVPFPFASWPLVFPAEADPPFSSTGDFHRSQLPTSALAKKTLEKDPLGCREGLCRSGTEIPDSFRLSECSHTWMEEALSARTSQECNLQLSALLNCWLSPSLCQPDLLQIMPGHGAGWHRAVPCEKKWVNPSGLGMEEVQQRGHLHVMLPPHGV